MHRGRAIHKAYAGQRRRTRRTRLPNQRAGSRVHFLKRLREAVPDIGDVERIDISEPGRARDPSYAGRTLRTRS